MAGSRNLHLAEKMDSRACGKCGARVGGQVRMGELGGLTSAVKSAELKLRTKMPSLYSDGSRIQVVNVVESDVNLRGFP